MRPIDKIERLLGRPAVEGVHRDAARIGKGRADGLEAGDVLVDREAGTHLDPSEPGRSIPRRLGGEVLHRGVEEEAAAVAVKGLGARTAAPEIGAGHAQAPAGDVPGGQGDGVGRPLSGRVGDRRCPGLLEMLDGEQGAESVGNGAEQSQSPVGRLVEQRLGGHSRIAPALRRRRCV